MRGTIDANSYDRFDYTDYDQSKTLDEAVREASELRHNDPQRFHRVIALDAGETRFKVESVLPEQVYEEIWHRMVQRLLSIARRSKK